MKRWAVGLLASALVVAPAAGQDKAEDVVKKAIEAHGGADVLKKLVAGTASMKGKLSIGGNEVPVTGTQAYQLPGKMRQEFTIDAMGNKLTFRVIVNGDKVTQTVNGMPVPPMPGAADEAKQAVILQDVSQLVPLLDKSRFTISAEKDAMVDGKPAAVVLVKAKGLNDTRVYFDKQTGYMVKTLRKGLNLEGKEVEEATVNSNFEKVMGVVVPKKAVVTHDGKPFMTAEVTEYKLAEKLDPKLFTTAD